MRKLVPITVLAACCLSDLSSRAQEHANLPGPTEIPSFLVSTNTRQVYRIHLSGLHAADAATLTKQLWPIFGSLPMDNPFRNAALQVKTSASFEDDYRSMRSQLLGAGVDTIYLLVEAEWLLSADMPGYIVIPGTAASRDRLRTSLDAAGHQELAKFLTQFQPATGEAGWLVCPQGGVQQGKQNPASASLVEHALKNGCPLQRASLTPQRATYSINLHNTWPITVVNLGPRLADRVAGPIVAALAPSMARVIGLVGEAKATTASVAVAPLPHTRLVATLANERAARELAREITKSVDGAIDQAVGDDQDNLKLLAGLFLRSTIVIQAHGKDTAMHFKPAVFFDQDLQRKTTQRMQQEDWTAVRPPAGYNWEFFGEPGKNDRHDILARVESIRVLDGLKNKLGPTALKGEALGRVSFQIPVAGGDTMTVLLDRRGNVRIEPPKHRKTRGLPSLELLDGTGERLAILRLDGVAGEPRFELLRTQAMLEERLRSKSAAKAKANNELNDAQQEMDKELASAQGATRGSIFIKWRPKIQAKRVAVRQETFGVLLLTSLARSASTLRVEYPAVALVKNDGSTAATINPFLAQRAKQPFADQWLLGDDVLLTLHQDSKGLVAGNLSAFGAKQVLTDSPVMQKYGILSGKADGNTMTFTWIAYQQTHTGRFILEDDGVSGTWEEGSSRSRVYRLDVGLPEAIWFQAETGDFEGAWDHPTRRYDNITLKKIQHGFYEGTIAQGYGGKGNVKACAVGKSLFMLYGLPSSATYREFTLAADGASLTFDLPGGGLIAPSKIELTKRK